MDKAEKKSKHGSEKRQATERLTLRLTPEQSRQLDEWTNDTGLARCSYVRAKLFSGQPIRLVRRAPVESQALGQFLAWLGRLNGNVYQFSRAANFGEPHEAEAVAAALKEITDMRNAVLAALGREAV